LDLIWHRHPGFKASFFKCVRRLDQHSKEIRPDDEEPEQE
jgi:hypothetical protein